MPLVRAQHRQRGTDLVVEASPRAPRRAGGRQHLGQQVLGRRLARPTGDPDHQRAGPVRAQPLQDAAGQPAQGGHARRRRRRARHRRAGRPRARRARRRAPAATAPRRRARAPSTRSPGQRDEQRPGARRGAGVDDDRSRHRGRPAVPAASRPPVSSATSAAVSAITTHPLAGVAAPVSSSSVPSWRLPTCRWAHAAGPGGDRPVVEGAHDPRRLLARLVALAGQQHGVARTPAPAASGRATAAARSATSSTSARPRPRRPRARRPGSPPRPPSGGCRR